MPNFMGRPMGPHGLGGPMMGGQARPEWQMNQGAETPAMRPDWGSLWQQWQGNRAGGEGDRSGWGALREQWQANHPQFADWASRWQQWITDNPDWQERWQQMLANRQGPGGPMMGRRFR